jgi:hypothetical protein
MLKFVLPLAILPVLAFSQPAEARDLYWWQTVNPDGTPAYDNSYALDRYDDRYGPDPYVSDQDRFNDREYRMYRRDMMRRMRRQAYYNQNLSDDPGADPNLPYAAPVTPVKPSIAKKAVQAKPAAKPVNPVTGAPSTTQTATAQPATPKKVTGSVTCDKGLSIVSSFGFEKVSSKSCDGNTFVYSAERSGKPFEIEVSSASGELTAVKKL